MFTYFNLFSYFAVDMGLHQHGLVQNADNSVIINTDGGMHQDAHEIKRTFDNKS